MEALFEGTFAMKKVASPDPGDIPDCDEHLDDKDSNRVTQRPTSGKHDADFDVFAANAETTSAKDNGGNNIGDKQNDADPVRAMPSNDKPIRYVTPKDFELLKVIGMGAFGKVLQVRNRQSQKILAMKVISKRLLKRNSGYVENIHAERDILTKIRHPFVVTMHCSFQTKEKLFIIMDFLAGGELFLRLGREGIFRESTAAFYLGEIILALDHLHSCGVLHRDLKPENILLVSQDNDVAFKIADFGLACECREEQLQRCGSPGYVAPEILKKRNYGKKCDIFSAGIILYILLSSRAPFFGKSTNEILVRNKECKIYFQDRY